MSQFVRIPDKILRAVTAEACKLDPSFHSRIPPEYYSRIKPISIVFWQRLRLLNALLRRHARQTDPCLDFGGGGGVFTPTLAGWFEQVTLLDLATREAAVTCDRYNLANVTLIQGDACEISLPEGGFRVVVAADVLEHFRHLDDAVTPIRRWLADGGLLVTSLPTETLVYDFLRLVFRTQKPEDHYHRAIDVERFLEERGFRRLERRYAPLPLPLTPLFYITAWRKIG